MVLYCLVCGAGHVQVLNVFLRSGVWGIPFCCFVPNYSFDRKISIWVDVMFTCLF